MSTIHQNKSLLIRMATAAPAALHQGLITALINALKFQMQCGVPIPNDVQGSNFYLLQLLASLQADEQQLERMNTPVDIPNVDK